MEALLDYQKLFFFAVLVFPGLVSIHVYRLMIPARIPKWESTVLEGLFYSIVNFALCVPLLVLIVKGGFPPSYWIRFWLEILAIFLAGPCAWPILYLKVIRSAWLAKHLQNPYPTAWDCFFGSRQECFLLVHLTDGKVIGGFFGPGSFAGAFPHHGDLYIAAVYRIDDEGRFIEPVADTLGVLLRKEDYAYIEMFDVPSGDL